MNRAVAFATALFLKINSCLSMGLAEYAPNQSLPFSDTCGCEGEVASVQNERRIFDLLGTDDGRGVLSARELSASYS